ncbi:MAG TPA: hypothetical protein VEK08_07375 [Planctomycetota bacterium]|nr:hypothetical protein [Planctomycetota bacterium]
MAQATFTLNRSELLRGLPRHLLFALVLGLVVGPLMWLVKEIEVPEGWEWIAGIPIAALWANAAALPIALPGRHWGYGFISAGMIFLLLVAGAVLGERIMLSHSIVKTPLETQRLMKVNLLTFELVLSGAGIGLFYGLLAGKKSAMWTGLALGGAIGFVLGIASLAVVTHAVAGGAKKLSMDMLMSYDRWKYDTFYHFAWQTTAAAVALHLAGCIGAALGAGAAAPVAAPVQGTAKASPAP